MKSANYHKSEARAARRAVLTARLGAIVLAAPVFRAWIAFRKNAPS